MIKDENFVSIQGWMVKLGIKGNALIAYACIYGFSQDGESEFKGSAQYIADWCGISRTAAFDVLKSLVEKNLIIKNDIITNGVKLCNYKYNFQGIKKLVRGGQETCAGGSQETCHHTIYSNDKETIDIPKKTNVFIPVFETYISVYESIYGFKPTIVYSRITEQLKKITKDVTIDQIIMAIEYSRNDEFSKKVKHELGAILSGGVIGRLINEYYSKPLPLAKAVPREAKKCPKCGGEMRGSACTVCYTNYDYQGNEI